jgi:hypothetical protein
MNKRLYEALIKKYEAQIAEGEATLEIYFTNSVGIGEHPQHLEEMDKYVTMITDAQDKKDTLEQFYKYNEKQWL